MTRDEYYTALANSDYLSHHGILGQKWGVRRFQNADGTLTALGRRRYYSEDGESLTKEGAKALINEANANKNKSYYSNDNSFYNGKSEMLNNAYEKFKEVSDAHSKMNDNTKNIRNVMSKYKEDENKYISIAATDEAMGSSYTPDLDDISRQAMFYYDDGDNGQSSLCYLMKTGRIKSASDLLTTRGQLNDDRHNAAYNYVSTLINDSNSSSINNKKVNSGKTYIADRIGEMAWESDAYDSSVIRAEEGVDLAIRSKKSYSKDNYKRSESFLNNLDKSVWTGNAKQGYSGWTLFNQAIKNLDMGSIKSDEMTSSDWDRLNAEIRRLRKTS